MLKTTNIFKNVALVGSTSEIGNSIVELLKSEKIENLYIFGRDSSYVSFYQNDGINTKFFQYDIEDVNTCINLQENLNSLGKIDLAIISLGFLPPENQDLESGYVLKSMLINAIGSSFALACFANKMLDQESGKILYISSVASMRPRLKNFTYGASKKAADFFAQGLQSKYRKTNLKIFILRPGFVFTKMSKDFEPAPFAINPKDVALAAIYGIRKNKEIIYSPPILKYLMNLVVRLPRFIFNKL